MFGRSKDMKRTCKRCGNSWYLPKRVANERPPSRLDLFAASAQQLSLSAKKQLAAMSAESDLRAREQRVLANGQCPSCGSSDYKQTKG